MEEKSEKSGIRSAAEMAQGSYLSEKAMVSGGGTSARKQNLPAWIVKPLAADSLPLSALSDEELYKKCRECGQSAKEWSRRFAALLPEVAKRGLHRRKGFVSLGEFAGKVAGMSEYAVDRILQLHAKIKDKPSLLKLFESGAEGWSKIATVAYVATVETDKLWAEKVGVLSTRALEVLVQNYRRKSVHVDKQKNETLFSQDAQLMESFNINLHQVGNPSLNIAGVPAFTNGPFGNYRFEPPVRFSFPASREVEFDLLLAKQRLEKQTKQALSWNETFQKIIEQSELAKSKILALKVSQKASELEEICARCSRKKALLKICEECSKKLGGGDSS